MDSDGDMKQSSPDDKNPKRRMKTPYQLEALERVYAVDRYPTETVRADLSAQLNLSDKQLQMWFCHRRLKDRKVKDVVEEVSNGRKKQKTDSSRAGPASKGYPAAVLESEVGDAALIGRNGYTDEFEFEEEEYAARGPPPVLHQRRQVVPEAEPLSRKRSQAQAARPVDSRAAAELAAIAAVENQLGEPVRPDGPALGVEFEPLPPGAFGAPIEHKSEPRGGGGPSHRMYGDDRAQERQEARPSKTGAFGLPPLPNSGVKRKAAGLLSGSLLPSAQHGSRTLREIQFLPEQPSGREENHHRSLQLNLHPNSDRPFDRVRSLPPMEGFVPGNMHLGPGDGFGFQERAQNIGLGLLPSGEGRARALYANGIGLEEPQRRGMYHSFDLEGQIGRHSAIQALAANQPFVGSESLAHFQEHEQARAEKKRKLEEAKVAKESEAHEKRMKKELERQELVRRKKEEQHRRELEKQDRDRKKEEERAMRERQREEERIQREQKRESERREKLVLKESKRMEKQLRKEELRKAKEAARIKAANERAVAKKLAKESLDLIEDERLELMEAATAQGLFTGLEPGQTVDSSKVILKSFPPSSVKMKVPLSIRPWLGLDENVANLFMVWRFLTTFADVIGLWPFTLDELAQALHDYDPRLLGEIHVALLKMLVKNVEEAANAAGSPNAMALAAGGHPHIVEAAYKWGFDIREWGQHVSPLTWPEILRQFALASGFGPKWRKRVKEAVPPPKEEVVEHRVGHDAVTILRSGAAAATAVAMMQGKGATTHMRRCKNRLAPGTVKYAAFHVLSLEGTKGLSILDVVEKIQESGLRDLTSTRTPEASIAAALSRDVNLFDRVAPSTYSVKLAFRRDPEEREEVLQAAREKIKLFQSGCLDLEDGEKEGDDGEDIERDEDYDSDGQDVEDIEVEVEEVPPPKEAELKEEVLQLEEGPKVVDVPTEEEMEIDESQVGEAWVQGLMEGDYSDLSVEERLNALVALVNAVNEGNCIRLALEARMEAASALKRQMWAEAQIERRRHKEELQAKLQASLPAEAKNESGEVSLLADSGSNPTTETEKQLDSLVAPKVATVPQVSPGANHIICTGDPLAVSERANEKNVAAPDCSSLQETALTSGHSNERSRAQVKADIGVWAEELYVVRSLPLGMDRRRNRYWQFVTSSSGHDPSCGRIYFESSSDGHWEVIDTEEALDALMMSLDSRGIRESALHCVIRRFEGPLRNAMPNLVAVEYPGKDTVKDVVKSEPSSPWKSGEKSLVRKGVSGGSYNVDGDDSPVSGLGVESPERVGAIQVELGKTDAEKQKLLLRYKEFEQWIWSESPRTVSALRAGKATKKRDADLLASCLKCHDIYWATDKHCHLCHVTIPKNQSKLEVHVRECEERLRKKDPCWKVHAPTSYVPPRIQILKADILSIEAAIPADALESSWDYQYRKAWAASLKRASTPAELLQVLTELESRVQREWLSSTYETAEEMLSVSSFCGNIMEGQVPPWVPHTSAAVALRVMIFDAALAYSQDEKKRRQKQEEEDQKPTHPNNGASTFWTTPDQPGMDNGATEEDGDLLGDAVGQKGRNRGTRGGVRGRGSRGGRATGNRSAPSSASVRVRTDKKGLKRKLQFTEDGQGANDAKQQSKLGVKTQSRSSRGKSRPRPGPRARARIAAEAAAAAAAIGGLGTVSARGGRSRTQVARRSFPKEKNPNELMAQEVTKQKSESEEVAEHEEAESDDDGTSKGEWEEESDEQSEEPQDVDEDDENTGTMAEEEDEDDGEDDEQPEEDDEDGQAEEGEDDEDRQYEEDSYDKEVEDEEMEGGDDTEEAAELADSDSDEEVDEAEEGGESGGDSGDEDGDED